MNVTPKAGDSPEDILIKKRRRKTKSAYAYFEYDRNIIIRFEKYFGEEMSEYDDFILAGSKKSYAKKENATFFVEENNLFLSHAKEDAQEFLYRYLILKKALDAGVYSGNQKAFINDLIGKLMTERLLAAVARYVDSEYRKEIRPEVTRAKQIETYTFLDHHYKILFSISTLFRLCIPIACHFLHYNPTIATDQLLLQIMNTLFQITQHDQINLMSKIEEFIGREIGRSENANQKMWNDLEIFGFFPLQQGEMIRNSILVNIFPRFVFERNIISFISVSVRNMVKYVIRGEFPYSIHSLVDMEGASNKDDNMVSEAEAFDSYKRVDELMLIIRSNFADATVDKILAKTGIGIIDPAEIEFYRNGLDIHEIQQFVIFQMFADFYGGPENIYACPEETWIKLMIIASHQMKNLGIKYLPYIVTGKRNSYSQRRTTKGFERSISTDERYDQIRNSKYKFVTGILDKHDFIRDKIKIIMNNNYEHFHFGHPDNGLPILKDEEVVKDEIFKFFQLCVG